MNFRGAGRLILVACGMSQSLSSSLSKANQLLAVVSHLLQDFHRSNYLNYFLKSSLMHD